MPKYRIDVILENGRKLASKHFRATDDSSAEQLVPKKASVFGHCATMDEIMVRLYRIEETFIGECSGLQVFFALSPNPPENSRSQTAGQPVVPG